MVGLESFQRLLKVLNKRADLKHRTTYSKMVKVKAAEIKQEILDIINTVKGDLTCAAFTTDMWTSAAGRSGQYIGKQLSKVDILAPLASSPAG